MIRTRLLSLLIPVAAALMAAMPSDRLTFEAERCAVTLPATWERNPEGEVTTGETRTILNARSADGVALVVIVSDLQAMSSLRKPGMLDNLRSKAAAAGKTIDANRYISVGGVDAMEIATQKEEAKSRVVMIVANKRMYMLSFGSVGVDLVKNAEVSAIIESFAFIGTPEVPPAPDGQQ